MKKVSITILTLLLCLGFGYAQENLEVRKVDSPYRLLKGVTLVNDLRMTTTTLNGVIVGVQENPNPKVSGNNDSSQTRDKEMELYWRQRNRFAQYRNLFPALVLDGVLTNDNSQRLNPVSFPTFDLTWQNGF